MTRAELVTLLPVAALALAGLLLEGYGAARGVEEDEEPGGRGRGAAAPARSARARRQQSWLVRVAALVAVAVLLPPLGRWGSANLFARSMGDVAMAFVVAPLAVLGAPWAVFRAALPALLCVRRREVGRRGAPLGSGPARRGGRRAGPGPARGRPAWGRPVSGAVALAAVIALWHVPDVLDATVRPAGLWDVELLSYLAGGVLFWRQVVGSYPHEPSWEPLARSWLIVGVLGVTSVLGAAMVFSGRLMYPAFTTGSLLSGSLDQGFAGAILWSVPAIPLGAAAIWCYLEWLRQDENDDLRLHRLIRRTEAATPGLRTRLAGPSVPPGGAGKESGAWL